MKTLVGFIIVILLFAGLVLPLDSTKTEMYEYKLEYKIPKIEKSYIDSNNKKLDSIVNFSERNLKYLEYQIKRMKKPDTITNVRTPLF